MDKKPVLHRWKSEETVWEATGDTKPEIPSMEASKDLEQEVKQLKVIVAKQNALLCRLVGKLLPEKEVHHMSPSVL